MFASLLTINPVTIPSIPFGAISVELVLFLVATIAIGIEAAGRDRVAAAVLFGGLTIGGGAFGLFTTTDADITALLTGVMAVGLVQVLAVIFVQRRTRLLTALITWCGLAVALGLSAYQWMSLSPGPSVMNTTSHSSYGILGAQSFLEGFVVLDGMGLGIRIALIVFAMLVIPLSYAYLEERQIHRVEYYPLIVLATTGMSLLANTNNLMMMFLSIEIFSLALYILTALAKRDEFSQEAAVKYFVIGGAASAVFLYGAAIMYGLSGTMVLTKIGQPFIAEPGYHWAAVSGMVLMATGFAFKVGLVPFHFWMPDVYQGAPTPVTAFMAAATKAAAFAAFMRVFGLGLGPLQWTWMPMVSWLAGITMLFGAIGALLQQDLKRILGYSAIAHAGYIAMALLGTTYDANGGFQAVGAMVLYLFLYGITVIGAFGMVAYLERRDKKALAIDDLRGLGVTHPMVAGVLTFFMLGLAGIPTTAGFIGKFAIFRSAFIGGYVGVTVIAIVTSVIAAAFYLRIIAPMWMAQPDPERGDYPVMSMGETFSLGLVAIGTISFGLLPGLVVSLAYTASSLASTM